MTKFDVNKRQKYVYEIEYINAKDGEPKYYIGSRICYCNPENDLLIKYFTSSTLVKDIIKNEGKESFRIKQLIKLKDDNNVMYEEQKLLMNVDARNNNLYFNLHNNEGFNHKETGAVICQFCGRTHYGHNFEKCPYCKKINDRNYEKNYCKNCGHEIKHATAKCSACGYCICESNKYYCKNCNKLTLNNPAEICPLCGFSHSDQPIYPCKNCGEMLNNPGQRCNKCGYCMNDCYELNCMNCGSKVKSSFSTCKVCGIYKAGSKNLWLKFNPFISIQLNDKELIIGTPKECTEFLENLPDIRLSKKRIRNIIRGEAFEPKSEKYYKESNEILEKYRGLVGIKISRFFVYLAILINKQKS